jgi:uncharacterized membrane protein (DUF485 family)
VLKSIVARTENVLARHSKQWQISSSGWKFAQVVYRRKCIMSDSIVAKIEANPKYHELRRKRNALGWSLTLLMLVVYFGYIALIAFNKPFLAQPIGNGVTTLGIPIGLGVIIFTIVITGIYVRRANGEYDQLTAEILKEASK